MINMNETVGCAECPHLIARLSVDEEGWIRCTLCGAINDPGVPARSKIKCDSCGHSLQLQIT